MKPLISIGDLMSFGFQAIKDTWKPTLKYSIWFFLLPLIYYVVITVMALAGAFSGGGVGVGLAFWIVYFVGMIAMILGLLWAAISLFQYMLAYASGTNMKSWKPKHIVGLRRTRANSRRTSTTNTITRKKRSN